jgi:hypothetical protein
VAACAPELEVDRPLDEELGDKDCRDQADAQRRPSGDLRCDAMSRLCLVGCRIGRCLIDYAGGYHVTVIRAPSRRRRVETFLTLPFTWSV